MTSAIYIEDLLLELNTSDTGFHSIMSWSDAIVCHSIVNRIEKDERITASQSKLLLKLLAKYHVHYAAIGIDYTSLINNPIWKNSFRQLDNTRSITIFKDEDSKLWYKIKIPYSLNETFHEEILKGNSRKTVWDSETKTRNIPFYDYSIFEILDFANKHKFEIDDTVIAAQNFVEEVLVQEDSLFPHSVIENNKVVLKNAPEDAITYWDKNQSFDVNKDMFLAKSMGFPVKFEIKPKTIIERICQSDDTFFWIKSNRDFFSLHKSLKGVTCVLLDRNTQNIIEWLESFVKDAENSGISRTDIRVCFRENKDSSVPLNDWVRENNLGGPVDGAKILIFKHKPAKWLFTNDIDVKVIVTNSYTPVNDALVAAWLDSHHCRCYLGEIKPTVLRTQKIVSV